MTNQTPLEQIKAALAELKKQNLMSPDYELSKDPCDYIDLRSEKWLNLLRVIELQSECLSKISSEFGTDYCDGNCVDARINLEQSAAILSGGSNVQA